MSAEEILKSIRSLSDAEKDKLFLGIMEDFKDEMMKSPAFMQHATSIMHEYMGKMREGGMDVSIFEAIAKK
ncbi:MAG: hypothetical protein RQ824_07510 [bacterium]|nr:hypothetical protein [bacterium]